MSLTTIIHRINSMLSKICSWRKYKNFRVAEIWRVTASRGIVVDRKKSRSRRSSSVFGSSPREIATLVRRDFSASTLRTERTSPLESPTATSLIQDDQLQDLQIVRIDGRCHAHAVVRTQRHGLPEEGQEVHGQRIPRQLLFRLLQSSRWQENRQMHLNLT
ncbi:unnamed protein product, partial [Trichogramma brassicae]